MSQGLRGLGVLRGPAEPEKGKAGNWEHRPGQRLGAEKAPALGSRGDQ